MVRYQISHALRFAKPFCVRTAQRSDLYGTVVKAAIVVHTWGLSHLRASIEVGFRQIHRFSALLSPVVRRFRPLNKNFKIEKVTVLSWSFPVWNRVLT
jgi:hypothetical protein